MEYRELGSSGLRVSVLTMGTLTFGGCEPFAGAYPRRVEPVRTPSRGPFEEGEADQSAMIRLAYAVSEPCGPWGVRQG